MKNMKYASTLMHMIMAIMAVALAFSSFCLADTLDPSHEIVATFSTIPGNNADLLLFFNNDGEDRRALTLYDGSTSGGSVSGFSLSDFVVEDALSCGPDCFSSPPNTGGIIGKFGGAAAAESRDRSYSTPFTPVPEPSTLLLLGTGLIGGIGAMRRKLAR